MKRLTDTGISSIISLVLIALCLSNLPQSLTGATGCKAWLVQSIPTDMPELPLVPGVLSTADVLVWLSGNTSSRLDIMAQYWQLVAQPDNSTSGDYGYSKEEMLQFGAQEGLNVYKAIQNAADRKAQVRLLQHSGVYPDYTKEPSELSAGRPNVKDLTLLLSQWWGSGIVHAKVWISDGRDVYIGSANNDWKSLTQVKELGIYITGCPEVAEMVEVYYNNLWKLGSLNASEYTTTIWDPHWQVHRLVPCWSHFIAPKARCRSPLPHHVHIPHGEHYPALLDRSMFHLSMQTPGYSSTSDSESHLSYLSFAPPELSFGHLKSDEQAWVDTIFSVNNGAVLSINTMDWLGQSQYTQQTIYWSTLSSAVSEVVFSKNATVRILVAHWVHLIDAQDEYLKSLLFTNVLCHSSKYNHCSGKVEIKYYEVPGYSSTGPAVMNGNRTQNKYPGYTRVNHGKYAVSDVRAHIGTSNLIWDYFYTTAGVSFGTYNPAIVSQLQQIFEADWNSPYTVPVEPLMEIQTQTS